MSFLRDAALLAMGEIKFTRSGYYDHAKSFDPHILDASLEGKSYMVTGGNSGIGRYFVDYLLTKGARVHLLVKEGGRTEMIRSEFSSRLKLQDLHHLVLHSVNLAEIQQVKFFCDSFLVSGEKLDGLVHNASYFNQNRMENSEGLDITFMVNLLAPFLLTNMLIPSLSSGCQSRVIFVCSPSVYSTKVHLERMTPDQSEKYDGEQLFSETKRGLMLLAERFASLYSGTGVKFFSMHPGWVSGPDATDYKIDPGKLRTDEEGSDSLKWLIASPVVVLDDTKYNGSFFFDREIARKHLPASMTQNSEEEINRLWELLSRYGRWNPSSFQQVAPTSASKGFVEAQKAHGVSFPMNQAHHVTFVQKHHRGSGPCYCQDCAYTGSGYNAH